MIQSKKNKNKNKMQIKLSPKILGVVFASFVLGMPLGVSASFAQTSLKDALSAAYTSSDQLRASRAAVRQSDEAIARARAAYLPTVNLSASAGRTEPKTEGILNASNTQRATIAVEQLIWDGGRTFSNINSTIAESERARQNQILTEQSILLMAINAFFNVQSHQQEIAINENNVRVLTEQARAVQDRFALGAVTRTDVSQAKARLAAATGRLERSKGTLKSSIAQYQSVIGTAPIDLMMPDFTPDIPSSADEAETLALAKHPSILAARLTLTAAEFQLKRAYRTVVPSVMGSVNYGITRSNEFPEESDVLTASVNLNVPLYQGGMLNSAKRAAHAGILAASAQLSDQLRSQRQRVYSAYANWRATISEKAAAQSQIESAQLAFEGITQEAKLGARTTLDVLDTEQELLSARSNFIRAEREEFIAVYTILAEIGLLNANYLGLEGVQDPVTAPYSDEQKAKVTESSLGERRLKLLKKIEDNF